MMINQHQPVTDCTNLGEQLGLHIHVHACGQHSMGFVLVLQWASAAETAET